MSNSCKLHYFVFTHKPFQRSSACCVLVARVITASEKRVREHCVKVLCCVVCDAKSVHVCVCVYVCERKRNTIERVKGPIGICKEDEEEDRGAVPYIARVGILGRWLESRTQSIRRLPAVWSGSILCSQITRF